MERKRKKSMHCFFKYHQNENNTFIHLCLDKAEFDAKKHGSCVLITESVNWLYNIMCCFAFKNKAYYF